MRKQKKSKAPEDFFEEMPAIACLITLGGIAFIANIIHKISDYSSGGVMLLALSIGSLIPIFIYRMHKISVLYLTPVVFFIAFLLVEY